MDVRMVTKDFAADLLEVVPGSREVVAVISTPAVDRDGEVVLPGGLVRRNYAGTPVLFNHDPAKPIGKSLWVKSDGNRVIAKHRFSDATDLSRDCFALAQEGTLRTYSVGFTPLESGAPTEHEIKNCPAWAGVKKIYRSWDMVEYSLAAVPANTEAVQLAVAKGCITKGFGELLVPKAAGAVKVHAAGVEHARRLIAAGKVDRNGSWSPEHPSPGKGGDWDSFSQQFLGEDDGSPPDTAAHWKYPVVQNGKVFLSGIRAAISRAGQNGAPGVEAAARGLLMMAERKSLLYMVRKFAAARGVAAD